MSEVWVPTPENFGGYYISSQPNREFMDNPQNVPGWRPDFGDGPTVGDIEPYQPRSDVLAEVIEAQLEFIATDPEPYREPASTEYRAGLDVTGNHVTGAEGADPTLEIHNQRIVNAMDEPPYRR